MHVTFAKKTLFSDSYLKRREQKSLKPEIRAQNTQPAEGRVFCVVIAGSGE